MYFVPTWCPAFFAYYISPFWSFLFSYMTIPEIREILLSYSAEIRTWQKIEHIDFSIRSIIFNTQLLMNRHFISSIVISYTSVTFSIDSGIPGFSPVLSLKSSVNSLLTSYKRSKERFWHTPFNVCALLRCEGVPKQPHRLYSTPALSSFSPPVNCIPLIHEPC